MKEITVTSVRNKGIYHEIAILLDALSVMNIVTLSWIVHTGYVLQEPQQLITNPNLMEATMPDQVQGMSMKTGTGKIDPISFLQTLQFKSSQFIHRPLKVTEPGYTQPPQEQLMTLTLHLSGLQPSIPP